MRFERTFFRPQHFVFENTYNTKLNERVYLFSERKHVYLEKNERKLVHYIMHKSFEYCKNDALDLYYFV